MKEGSISHRSRGKLTGHVKYDRELGEYVSISLHQDIVMPVRAIRTKIKAVADIGATTCCAPLRKLKNLGTSLEDTCNPSVHLSTVDRRKLNSKDCTPSLFLELD